MSSLGASHIGQLQKGNYNRLYPIRGYLIRTVSENNKIGWKNDCEVKSSRRMDANLTRTGQTKKFFIV